jgi:TIR domain
MPYDVFISHSTEDRLIAEAVCNRLEREGVRCWIAPRDISPGEGWTAAILRGIEACRIMVLIFSEHANNSHHVRREVAHACSHELVIIPIRIRDTTPSGDLSYYLNELYWLDALQPPLEKHLETLVARVHHLLSGDESWPPTQSAGSKKSVLSWRTLHPGILAITSAGALIGISAALFFWPSGSLDNRQSIATPTPELGIPIPPVVNLTDGLRLTIGEQKTLLKDRELGLHDIGGQGVGVVEKEPNRLRFLLQVGDASYLIEGTDLNHLNSAHSVLTPGSLGEFDNCGAGVGAVVRVNDTRYAFYEARDCEGATVYLAGAGRGEYCSIGIAESSDGKTWLKRGQIIRNIPKEEDHTRGGVLGMGHPGAVLEASGRYIYLYYACFSGQPSKTAQVCMARSDLSKGPPLPGNWEKLYNGDFTEPGLGGKETALFDSYASEKIASMYPHVLFSQSLKRYILTFGLNRQVEINEGLPPTRSGIYLALSTDGIKWEEPTKIVNAYCRRVIGLSISIEPTIILDDPTKLSGWLVYAHTPKFTNGTLPGTRLYLVGRRIEFVKTD